MSIVEVQEELVFFPSGDSALAGVLTAPAVSNGIVVLIPWGSGTAPSSGRNRIRAHMAAWLADQGCHAFRFDYRGVGESGGDMRKPGLDRPYTEDILAACHWLRAQGFTRIVVIANCFGGWSSLMAAPQIPGLEGMVIMNAPVRRDHDELAAAQGSLGWWAGRLRRVTIRKLLNSDYRERQRQLIGTKVSSIMRPTQGDKRYSEAVRHLIHREIPVLLIYGEGDFRADFEAELNDGLRAIVDASPRSRVVTIDRHLADASLASQELVIREIEPWLAALTEARL